MIGKYLIATAALAALLSACTSPQQQRRAQQGRAAERTLDRIGTIGDPGLVAAADIAFARRARDEGQWTAFREFAAPGAVIHGSNGPVAIETFTSGREDPAVSNAWTPNTIWASCDGTLAVTFGRMQVPSGDVGSYVTVWQLQRDRSYKWAYDVGTLDDPQPVPASGPDVPEGEEVIIVPGMTAIEGRVADCPARGEASAEIPIVIAPSPTRHGGARSDDGTLQYTWMHTTGGERRVIIDWVREGVVQRAAEFIVPPGAE